MIRKKDEYPLIKKDMRYEKLEEFLTPSTKDSIHSGIKTGLSIIPGFGGVIAEIFSRAVESPLEKRKREFLIAMAIKLDDLEKTSYVSSEDYRNDDEFLDILLQCLEIAIKNSQKEKLEMLKNAILNTALKIDIERDLKTMFLNLIVDVTPSHLQVLKLCAKPESVVHNVISKKVKKNQANQNLEEQFTFPDDFGPYLGISKNEFNHIAKNLESWDLVNTANKHTSGLPENKLESITSQLIDEIQNQKMTSFGKKFLQFISEPELV